MRKIIISLMLLAMLFIAGCTPTDSDWRDCFKKYAEDYCDSINQSFISVEDELSYPRFFKCMEGREIKANRFRFIQDERDDCISKR